MKLREIMSSPAVTIDANSPVWEAAKLMRDENIGDVLVMRDGKAAGIVTDRDLAVRLIAEGLDPNNTPVSDISSDMRTLSPDDDVDAAIELIRNYAVRRIPIIDGNQPLGVVTIGDLAIARDRSSALADVSAAPPNG